MGPKFPQVGAGKLNIANKINFFYWAGLRFKKGAKLNVSDVLTPPGNLFAPSYVWETALELELAYISRPLAGLVLNIAIVIYFRVYSLL